MKVTVCQLDNRQGCLEPMLKSLAVHIRENHSDFLLLPEMCFSEWLAVDPTPNLKRWYQAVDEHAGRISKLAELGATAVLGTRPIVLKNGSLRNEAYLWSAAEGAQPVRQKYYLPDEKNYWENSWYDRGERRFELCRCLGMRIGVQICTEMWFFEWARHYA